MLLVIVMVLSMVPATALAEEPGAVEGAAAPAAALEVIQKKGKTAVDVGTSVNLTAKMSDGSALDAIVWEASDTTLVKLVPKAGGICTVKGKAAGDVTITAKANGQSASFTLKVNPVAEAPAAPAVAATPAEPSGQPAQTPAQPEQPVQQPEQEASKQIAEFALPKGGASTYANNDIGLTADGSSSLEVLKDSTVTLSATYLNVPMSAEWEFTQGQTEGQYTGVVDLNGFGLTGNSCQVTGVKAGNVGIHLKVTVNLVLIKNTYEKDFVLTVKDNGALTIQPEHNNDVYEGDTLKLSVLDKNQAPVSDISWGIEPAGAVTIDAAGNLTADNAGPVKITASKPGYLGGELNLEVKTLKDFSSFSLDGEDRPYALAVNEERTLSAWDANGKVENVTWEMPENPVAVLTGNKLFGKSEGPVSITVKKDGYKPLTGSISVGLAPATNVSVKALPAKMYAHSHQTLTIEYTPEFASDTAGIVWMSSNPSVAEIKDGVLYAYEAGSAELSARLPKDDKIVILGSVTVEPNTHIDFDAAFPKTILAGEALDLNALVTVRDAAGNPVPGASVTWKLLTQEEGVTVADGTLNTRWDMLYQHDLELEAAASNCDAAVVKKTIRVMPRSEAITLTINGEKVNDKTKALDLGDPNQVLAGYDIVAAVEPVTAAQNVRWQVIDDYGVCEDTKLADGSLNIKPSAAMQNGTVTIRATTQDGTTVSAQTKIQFVKLGKSALKNVPLQLRGGATLNLKSYLEQDKSLTDKSVTWYLENTADVVNGKSVTTGKPVASINKTSGKLTTKAVTTPHKIKVVVKGSNGETDAQEITVYPTTKSITVTNPKKSNILAFKKGMVIQLTAQVQPTAADAWVLEWDTSDSSVATVDPTGLVTVHDAGRVRISCQTTDGSKVKGYLNLEITKDAGTVQITGENELVVGDSTDLKAVVRTANGFKASNQKVTWSIEDEYGNATRAAIVSENGRVMAYDVVKETKVVVVATSVENSSVMGTHTMTIKPSTKRTLHVYADNEYVNAVYTMNPNDSCVLEGRWEITANGNTPKAKDCAFFSSNPYVATVDDLGLLESFHAGTTIITVKCTDPQTGNLHTNTFQVNVANMVSAVTITAPDNKVVRSGQWVKLYATAWMDLSAGLYADNQAFDWEVKEKDANGNYVDTDAATIDSNGWLLGGAVDKEHTIQIKAISKENGCNATVEFKVYPVDGVTLTLKLNGNAYKDGDVMPMDFTANRDATNKNVVKGLTVEAVIVSTHPTTGKVTVSPATDVTKKIEWTSTNTKVINFSANYKTITLENVGQTKLTAWYPYNGGYRVATVTVNVSQSIGEVVSIEQTNVLVSGKSTNMRVQVENANATNQNVIWSVDKTNLATINQYTGLLSAKRGINVQETLTVTATPVDGSPAKHAKVIIYPATTKVQIKDAAKNVVSRTRVDVKLGFKTATFTAAPIPAAAYDQFTWTSSNESVATVKDGVVTFKKAGRAVIKATAKDGTSKSAKFTLRITK